MKSKIWKIKMTNKKWTAKDETQKKMKEKKLKNENWTTFWKCGLEILTLYNLTDLCTNFVLVIIPKHVHLAIMI